MKIKDLLEEDYLVGMRPGTTLRIALEREQPGQPNILIQRDDDTDVWCLLEKFEDRPADRPRQHHERHIAFERALKHALKIIGYYKHTLVGGGIGLREHRCVTGMDGAGNFAILQAALNGQGFSLLGIEHDLNRHFVVHFVVG